MEADLNSPSCQECGFEFGVVAQPVIAAPSVPQAEAVNPPLQNQTIIIDNSGKKTGQPANEEIVYYTDNYGVRVTNTRFIAGTATYPMAGITSIRTIKLRKSRSGPVWLIVLGCIFLIAYGAGLLLLIPGIIWICLIKDNYAVRISTAAAESNAIISKNPDYIEHISRAINEAVIKRGW